MILKKLYEYNENGIRELLLYHKVEKISESELLLDNGTILEIVGNEGCSGCGAGWYELTELNGCDNAITNVEFVCEDYDNNTEYVTSYRIFVFAEDKRIKLAQVDGDDGNGYYGTGYTITVRAKG